MSNSQYEVKRGQTIAFRLPADTPDHVLKQLQKLRETERRNFSGKIADFVMQGVVQTLSRERETLTIPLPHKLSKSQRSWLKHEHSEALLGSILHQLITDPVRSTALLASMNSNATDINQALYLQEKTEVEMPEETEKLHNPLDDYEPEPRQQVDLNAEDDLSDFDWDKAKQNSGANEDEETEPNESIDDLLGEFLSHMNK